MSFLPQHVKLPELAEEEEVVALKAEVDDIDRREKKDARAIERIEETCATKHDVEEYRNDLAGVKRELAIVRAEQGHSGGGLLSSCVVQ